MHIFLPKTKAKNEHAPTTRPSKQPPQSVPQKHEGHSLQRFALHPTQSTPEIKPSPKGPHQTNKQGLPESLQAGIEALSGVDMSGVRVHSNSNKPKQLNALAYAQGNDIHLAPGQEKHLPHEAWHVVQQKQGRVKPTMQMAGSKINDDQGLEREADVMGARAAALQTKPHETKTQHHAATTPTTQKKAAYKKTVANQDIQLEWNALWGDIGGYFDQSVKEWFDIAAKQGMKAPKRTEFGHGSNKKEGGSRRANNRLAELRNTIWSNAKMSSDLPDKGALKQLKKDPDANSSPDVVQRLVNFGDGWSKYIGNVEMPKTYKECFDMGNEAALKELEALALRGSAIPDINGIMDFLGNEGTVTIREGVHDGGNGRESTPHQTVNVKVNKDTWAYHVFYAAGSNNWEAISIEQTNQTKGKPSLQSLGSPTLYPETARALSGANLALDQSGVMSGKTEFVGPITYSPTGETLGKYSEITVHRCPRYVWLENSNRWISTKSIS